MSMGLLWDWLRPAARHVGRTFARRSVAVGSHQVAEHALVFRFGQTVERGGPFLEHRALEDDDLAPHRPDRLPSLKDVHGVRDSGPAHAQHRRQELVGGRNAVLAQPVLGHEQPAGQPSFQRETRIGQRRLRAWMRKISVNFNNSRCRLALAASALRKATTSIDHAVPGACMNVAFGD